MPPFEATPIGSIPASDFPLASGPRGSMRGPVPFPRKRESARTWSSDNPSLRRSSPAET